ncbi:NYN domain-containing protein [Colletotrichum navitas]|uniref:NYN domain-containing protein n=1 Tax=Colletotrichum navitas TaxID=681940 RepID=A0AAD8PXJ9_9PEZI|nr:NYN domain-containing protein [Colletotrichum navitas]KAK1589961.1 NYN domain-containing protein [Colletotrichum navitas]
MATKLAARLAVLIDANNAQPALTGAILTEVAKYGTAHVKRAYGDWSAISMRSWKYELLGQSIRPMQQIAYTSHKNATDSAMIIDAMDLLHAKQFDGFCLVSSDNDFTPLALRIRESGLSVYGFGHCHTPKAFMAACNKFIYVDDIVDAKQLASHAVTAPPQEHTSSITPDSHAQLGKILLDTVEHLSVETGWASLYQVELRFTMLYPNFDPGRLGYPKEFSRMVEATGLFDFDRRQDQEVLHAWCPFRDAQDKAVQPLRSL